MMESIKVYHLYDPLKKPDFITLIDTNRSIHCPHCHREIEIKPISYIFPNIQFTLREDEEPGMKIDVFLFCILCSQSFVFEAASNKGDDYYELLRLLKTSSKNKSFPEEIIKLSKKFCQIYNQSYHAEQSNLNLICGPGYRKSFEFLVKDFLIKHKKLNKDLIEKNGLKKCLELLKDDFLIKSAERTVWIGNDETHYTKKWLDKDIKDLKKLIDICVYHIETIIIRNKYIQTMKNPKK